MATKSKSEKDREYLVDISGPGVGNRPKAHVIIRYFEQYHDGTTKDIQVLSFEKPIVNIFAHAGYTNVMLDFHSRSDQDLRMAWSLYTEYSNPINSVSYLPEEMERGFYTENGTEKMVYFPMLEVILSPIGKESEYEIHGLNPAFITLAPANVQSQEPCVMQFTFDSSWFHIVDQLEPIDYSLLKMDDSLDEDPNRP